MNTILVIIKKELKRFFTDRRMLISLILPGLLIFFVYSVMGEYVGDLGTGTEEYNVGIVNNQEELNSFNSVDGWVINISIGDKDDLINDLKAKELDLVIVYDENFYYDVINYSSGVDVPNVELFYNSSDVDSSIIYQYYLSVFEVFESSLINRFNVNALNDVYDIAQEEDVTMQIMTMIMPFIFVTLLFSGCMSVCSEAIAGEKERGTLATLLVTPVKRSHLVIGKVISLGITALFSAVVSFTGLMASIPKLMGGDIGMSFEMYSVGTFVLIFVVILSTVLIFTVILTMVSTFAKSVKEASSYSIPFMILVMVCGVGNLSGMGPTTNLALYLIPVYNSIQCITGVLSMNVNLIALGVAVVVNFVYFGIGIFVLTKMFNSEKIIFQK